MKERPTLRHHIGFPEFFHEFQEEHLSEIEFLLGQRQRHVRDPEFAWPALANMEDRLEAHVDAMCVGGAPALELAREAMAGGDEAQTMAGLYVVASFEEADGADGLGAVLHSMEEAAADLLYVWEEVLVLSEQPRVSERMLPLLSSPRAEVRATVTRALLRRHGGTPESLLPLLGDTSPEVRSAAVMALAQLGYGPAITTVENLLQYVPLLEWEPLTVAALYLSSPRALRHCRQACQSGGELPPGFPWLLAMAGEERDLPILQKLCAHPKLASHALRAVGILGIPSSVPFLLEHLSSDALEVRLAAGAALNLLTGANLYVTAQAMEEGADGDEPGREIHLPHTDAATWAQWWDGHQPRFSGSRRFRLGKPFSLGVCIEELAAPHSTFDSRERAAKELRIHSGQAIGFEPDWPIRRQRAAIARWQRWWADHSSRSTRR